VTKAFSLPVNDNRCALIVVWKNLSFERIFLLLSYAPPCFLLCWYKPRVFCFLRKCSLLLFSLITFW